MKTSAEFVLLRCVVALAVLSTLLAACSNTDQRAAALTGGNPHSGEAALHKYGCGSCHEIAGVTGAHGKVGPPLNGLGERAYVAGVLTNTPENLVRWIMTPRAVSPRTAMPELGVTEGEARDMAAYLYTLK